VEYRGATADDIGPIASLHADSWRRNYRGSFSDGSEWSEAPGGGSILGLRYVWPDPTVLL
jgi:hypothetical protein